MVISKIVQHMYICILQPHLTNEIGNTIDVIVEIADDESFQNITAISSDVITDYIEVYFCCRSTTNLL